LSKTLFVGCDLSSKTNTVCLMDEKGAQLATKTLTNTLSDAHTLESWLVEVVEKRKFFTLKIATEPTAFLDLHLVDFLASSDKLKPFNPSIYQLNPKIVSNFKRAYTDRDKIDELDAFVIADRLRFGRLMEPYETHKPYLPLRRLTRYRFHLVEAIAREKAYFLTHLYLKFSGFYVEKPFASLFGATSLAVITELSPDEIINLPEEQLADFVIQNSRKRFKEPEAVVKAVKRAARESYRLRPALSSSISLILASILQSIRALKDALRKVDAAIEKEFKALPNTLQSVKGIGPVYSAGIFSEVGDINRFPREDTLAKYAGLTWRKYQSGKFNAQQTRMTRTGNKYLRYYLIEAANALSVHNAEYKAYYEAKFKEVTKHQQKRALALTARKIVRLVYALLKKGQLYKADYQQEG